MNIYRPKLAFLTFIGVILALIIITKIVPCQEYILPLNNLACPEPWKLKILKQNSYDRNTNLGILAVKPDATSLILKAILLERTPNSLTLDYGSNKKIKVYTTKSTHYTYFIEAKTLDDAIKMLPSSKVITREDLVLGERLSISATYRKENNQIVALIVSKLK